MKYGNVTLGQVEAVINKLGGQEIWDAWLRGEKTVTVEDAVKVLFDKHGRRIPEGLQANVCDADRKFHFDKPNLDNEGDFANRIMQLHECLGIDIKVIAKQLRAESERLLAMIRENSQIANLLNGVCLPVVLPKFATDDLGSELELYYAGINKSYTKTLKDRIFHNYFQDTLASEVSVVDGSRHDQLVERMKEGPVIGLHFPNPLQGFSVNADREQMPTLPEGFILSGMDTLIAMMMYPDILARDWYTAVLDLSALQCWREEWLLYFEVNDDWLKFTFKDCSYNAFGRCSGGLLFIGS